MPSIVVSPGFALSDAYIEHGWKPVIGWQTVTDISNVAADAETDDGPASNLANPSTVNRWISDSTASQYVTVVFGVETEREIDYVGVARHNWGSAGITVSIEGLPSGGDPEVSGDWVEIIPEAILADDGPVMWRFETDFYVGIRIHLQPDAVAPFAAVLRVGKLLVLDRGVPPGHQPITYATTVEKYAGRAQSGDYLGTIVTGAGRASSIEQQDLDPDWYRANLEPFRAACEDEATFFWAWAPFDHPSEVGYCWVTNDPIPTVSQKTGNISITFQIGGLAL
jgi:hypothetical protein